jgi:hypothetical protein
LISCILLKVDLYKAFPFSCLELEEESTLRDIVRRGCLDGIYN